MMHPWGTIFDNEFYLEKTCKIKHDWKLSDVETRKVAEGSDVQRFRLVTRTCRKCGKSEQTYMRR